MDIQSFESRRQDGHRRFGYEQMVPAQNEPVAACGDCCGCCKCNRNMQTVQAAQGMQNDPTTGDPHAWMERMRQEHMREREWAPRYHERQDGWR